MDPGAQWHSFEKIAELESEEALKAIADAQILVDRINALIAEVPLHMPHEIIAGQQGLFNKSSRDWVVGHLDDAASEIRAFIDWKSNEVIGEPL